ncbi:uncharacterized protein LOC104434848 [Eucalyptus grandis]|uniref:uncharacterized protein LOC104434848 n=1 Tax=Eucalyptus grandis TaxID=71139 RepID=UPI00192F020D|nr:uncharacterized protein LOC104434848 [Eucalyptus grandis]
MSPRWMRSGMILPIPPPTFIDGKPVVYLSEDDILPNPKLHECILGYYVDKKLPFKLTETALKHAWGHHLADVMATDRFYLFHVPDLDFRRKILDEGLLTVARVPLILQQWCHLLEMELRKDNHSSVPVWIRLKNIPYELWSAPGISAVASAVGKPLYVDLRTEQMKMISFARVRVEISTKRVCCDSVDIVLNGETRTVSVEYEWRPVSCLSCGTFGHKCPSQASSAGPVEAPQPVPVGNAPNAQISASAPLPETAPTLGDPKKGRNQARPIKKKPSSRLKEAGYAPKSSAASVKIGEAAPSAMQPLVPSTEQTVLAPSSFASVARREDHVYDTLDPSSSLGKDSNENASKESSSSEEDQVLDGTPATQDAFLMEVNRAAQKLASQHAEPLLNPSPDPAPSAPKSSAQPKSAPNRRRGAKW